MKPYPLLVSLLTVNIQFAVAQEAQAPSSPPATHHVVASVGDAVMTQKDLTALVNWRMQQHGQLPPTEKERKRFRQQLTHETIKQFVVKTLLMKEVATRGITLTEDEMRKGLDAVPVPEGVSKEAYFEQSPLGKNFLWNDFINSLKVAKFVEAVQAPPVTESEQRTIKQAVHSARQSKKALISEIRNELLKGETFAELAKKYSDCASARQGGNLGRFQRGSNVVPTAFQKSAFSQKVNEIGPVIETPYGFHIIRVLEKTEAKQNDDGTVEEPQVHAQHILIKAPKPLSDDEIEKKAKSQRIKRIIKRLEKKNKVTWYTAKGTEENE